MAFVTISQLPVVENVLPLTAGDIMPIVHGPTTYQVALSTLQQYILNNALLSAAGQNGYVQVNENSALSAYPSFVYLKLLSSLQVGYNNLQTGFTGGILGGANNTNNNTNTFILGQGIQASIDNFTLVNNLSAMGLVVAGNYDSVDWSSAWTWANSQSARLSMPSLDTRYMNQSGDQMTGDLTTTGSISALSALYASQIGINTSALTGLPPNVAVTIVGNLSVTGSIYGSLTGSLPPIADTVYVSVSGDDTNLGTTMFSPFKTIKRAAAYVAQNQAGQLVNLSNIGAPGLSANKQYTIWCYAGNYLEQNPIYLPPSTSLMSDNLKRASIFPANPSYDILWQNNGNYTWGFTFRNHVSPAAANAFPVLSAGSGVAWSTRNAAMTAIAYQYGTSVGKPQLYDISSPSTKPFITTSPYIQGCSSITGDPDNGTPGGCGIRVDGSLVGGFLRSFVTDSFTQTNQGGIGIHVTNNGYAQLVSTFTICTSAGVQADKGGQCSINTSNCSFGTYGLLADGYSTTPILTGVNTQLTPFNTTTMEITGAFGTFNPATYALYNNWTVPVSAPYSGLLFTVSTDPVPGTLYYVSSAYVVNPSRGEYNIIVTNPITNALPAGGVVNFYIKSQITTSSHTMEYVGSGNVLTRAVPAMGGVANVNNEAVATNGASVYFTSTNNLGNFRVGTGFTILQDTGTIEGTTFQRSIISLVTPLTIALE